MLTPFSMSSLTKSTLSITNASNIACSKELTFTHKNTHAGMKHSLIENIYKTNLREEEDQKNKNIKINIIHSLIYTRARSPPVLKYTKALRPAYEDNCNRVHVTVKTSNSWQPAQTQSPGSSDYKLWSTTILGLLWVSAKVCS